MAKLRLFPRLPLLFLATGLIISCFALTSCEDDPIVEPTSTTKAGGSYGGRLAQPDSSQGGKTPRVHAVVNPEVF